MNNEKQFMPEADYFPPPKSPETAKTPLEQLEKRLDTAVERLAKKGLESDASEIEAVKGRVREYAEGVRKDRAALENKLGRKLSTSDYLVEKGLFGEDLRAGKRKEYSHSWTPPSIEIFSSRERTVQQRKGLKYGPEEEQSFRSFSKEGEEELYKALGVLGEDQRIFDLARIADEKNKAMGGIRARHEVKDILHLTEEFDIGIRGVELAMHKGEFNPQYKSRWEGLKINRIRDESTSFRFGRAFVASILGEGKEKK